MTGYSSVMKHHRFTNSTGTITVVGGNSGGVFKSRLECLGFIRAFLGTDVESVELQRPRIRYTNAEGKKRRYTGDLHVRFHERAKRRQLVIECKYARQLERDPELVEKLKHVGRAFDGMDCDFLIQTEADIRADGLPMMTFVFEHVNNPPHPASDRVMECVRVHKSISVADLIKAMGLNVLGGFEIIPEVWRLVAQRQLAVDFKETLNMAAKIRLPSV